MYTMSEVIISQTKRNLWLVIDKAKVYKSSLDIGTYSAATPVTIRIGNLFVGNIRKYYILNRPIINSDLNWLIRATVDDVDHTYCAGLFMQTDATCSNSCNTNQYFEAATPRVCRGTFYIYTM